MNSIEFSIKARTYAFLAFFLPLIAEGFYLFSFFQSVFSIDTSSTNPTFKIFPGSLSIAIVIHIIAILSGFLSLKYINKAQKWERKNRYERAASVLVWIGLLGSLTITAAVGVLNMVFHTQLVQIGI